MLVLIKKQFLLRQSNLQEIFNSDSLMVKGGIKTQGNPPPSPTPTRKRIYKMESWDTKSIEVEFICDIIFFFEIGNFCLSVIVHNVKVKYCHIM